MATKFISVWVGAGDYFHFDIRCPTVLGPVGGPFRECSLNMQGLAEDLAQGGFKNCELILVGGFTTIPKPKSFTACPGCVVPDMKKAMFGMLGEVKEKQSDALQAARSFKG